MNFSMWTKRVLWKQKSRALKAEFSMRKDAGFEHTHFSKEEGGCYLCTVSLFLQKSQPKYRYEGLKKLQSLPACYCCLLLFCISAAFRRSAINPTLIWTISRKTENTKCEYQEKLWDLCVTAPPSDSCHNIRPKESFRLPEQTQSTHFQPGELF